MKKIYFKGNSDSKKNNKLKKKIKTFLTHSKVSLCKCVALCVLDSYPYN